MCPFTSECRGPVERWLTAKPAPPRSVCVAGAKSRHSVFFLPGVRGRGWLRLRSRAAPAPAALTQGTRHAPPPLVPVRRGEPLLRAGHPETSSHLPAGPPAPVPHPSEPRGHHVRVCLSPAAAHWRAGGPGVTVPCCHPAGQGPVTTAFRAREGASGASRHPQRTWPQAVGRKKFPPVAAPWPQAATVQHASLCPGAVSRWGGWAPGLRGSATQASGVCAADVYTVPGPASWRRDARRPA